MKQPFFYRILRAMFLQREVYRDLANDREGWREAMAIVALVTFTTSFGLVAEIGIIGPILALAQDLVAWVVLSVLAFVIARLFHPEPNFRRLLQTLGLATAPGILRAVIRYDPTVGGVALLVGLWLLATSVVAVQVALDTTWKRASGIALILRALAVLALSKWGIPLV